MDSRSERAGPESIGQFLVQLIDAIVSRMTNTVDAMEDELLNGEQRLLDSGGESLRADLMKLRMRVISLKCYLTPQRDALHRLENQPLPWLNKSDRLRLRSVTDRQIRHVEDLDLVRERTTMALEALALGAHSALARKQSKRCQLMLSARHLSANEHRGLFEVKVIQLEVKIVSLMSQVVQREDDLFHHYWKDTCQYAIAYFSAFGAIMTAALDPSGRSISPLQVGRPRETSLKPLASVCCFSSQTPSLSLSV